MITTRAFWLGALERAVKTFCQTFLAVALLSLGGLTVGIDAGVTAVDWANVLSVSALATFLSLVTSVGNARFTAGDVVTPATSGPVIVNQPQGDPAVQVGGDDGALTDHPDGEGDDPDDIYKGGGYYWGGQRRIMGDPKADAAYHPGQERDGAQQ